MKKFIYSNYTKAVAATLFVVSITAAVVVSILGFANYCDVGDNAYGFEQDFTQSNYLKTLLNNPEDVFIDTYIDFYATKDGDKVHNTGEITDDGNVINETEAVNEYEALETTGKKTVEERLEYQLSTLFGEDKINYYIRLNDKVYTNCGATDGKALTNSELYSYVHRSKDGKIVQESNRELSRLRELEKYDKTSEIEIVTSIKDEYIQEFSKNWKLQEKIVNNMIVGVIGIGIFALIMLIYLICVCGADKDDNKKVVLIDKIWFEVHAALITFFAFCALFAYIGIMDSYYNGHFLHNMVAVIVGTATAFAATVFITSVLSIVRNIKCGRFAKSCIIIHIIMWIYTKIKNAKNAVKSTVSYALSKKNRKFYILTFVICMIIVGFCGLVIASASATFVCSTVLFAVMGYKLCNRENELDKIKKGVSEIRNYNAGYKIPELKCVDLRELAGNINDIGNSIDESVSAKMKAERMKTELITNVSHDLKTPLTSIISYTEILSKVENLPEEAQDYVKVIEKKSNRLKNLTQDLFDISKAQSGNDEVVFERLDAELLVNQTMAEFETEISATDIKFCVNTDKELFFSADSRKMSRVISNLVGNMLKYSMKNTRAFITAKECDGQIVIEFKNTSAYPLDFDAGEIMGRFVRGDESRTTEGNGLGLAIAKSYTELCNGTLDIILDGDMFKAIIKFRKY